MAYGIVAAVVLLMALLTAVTVHETPWRRELLSQADRAEQRHMIRDLALTILGALLVSGLALAAFRSNIGIDLTSDSLGVVQLIAIIVASVGAAKAFSFRPRANLDFTWVLLTRLFVMIGINTVTSFILNYMLAVVDPSNAQRDTTLFLVIVLVTATVSTAISGWASDRIGRKRMVYISGAFMAVVGAAFVIAPYVISGSSILSLVLGAGAVFGLGYGAYVAVDWALVADVLPSEATFARDMGVWNINLTVAQVFALVFGGVLIEKSADLGHANLGYTLLFVAFVVFCVAGTVTVRFIKGVKR